MATTYLVKSDVEVWGGGVTKQNCSESHTGKAAPKHTARYLEKIVVDDKVRNPSNHDSKLHGWLECKVLMSLD